MSLALVAVAIVELLTMLSVVLRVPKGMPPKPRHGKSWATIARETWATDVLQERSYVWLLISRLFFLTAGSLLVNFVVIYLGRAFGMTKEQANAMFVEILVVVVIANVLAILPGVPAVRPGRAQAPDLRGVRRRRGGLGGHRARARDPDRARGRRSCSGRRTGPSWPSTGP